MKKILCRLFALLVAATLLCGLFGCSQDDRPTQGVGTATLCAVGDISFSDEMLADARQTGGAYNFAKQLGDMAYAISGADLAVGNLEGTFAGSPYSETDASYPDVLAESLAGLGFDLLQTANTFSIFNGISGLERTINVVEDAGMVALGTYTDADDRAAHQVIIREIDGIRIAFVAFTKGFGGMSLPVEKSHCANLLYDDYTTNYDEINSTAILNVLEQAKNATPDVIVAMLHWGSEGIETVSESQEDIASLMLQNGVDVILGTHSHRVGPVEQRKITRDDGTQRTAVVAYGLGDFNRVGDDGCTASLMLTLEFTRNHGTGTTTISDIRCQTVAAVDRGESADPRFSVADGETTMSLYENNFYDRIPDEVYTRLLVKQEDIRKILNPEPEPEN